MPVGSSQKPFSAPQKQPMPNTARSVPSGNGGSSGVPSTKWRSGTGIFSSRPGRASSGAGMAVLCPSSLSSTSTSLRGEERQIRLSLAAQHRQVDLGTRDPTRLREPPRLRLEHLRGEHTAAGTEPRRLADALEVAAELLNRL